MSNYAIVFPTLEPKPTEGLTVNGLTFFTGCDQMKIAVAEIKSAHPRQGFLTHVFLGAAHGFEQTAIPALQPYAAAMREAAFSPLNQLATARTTLVMCRASGQT